ncbi:MAG: transcription termination factor NusA [Planctomycetota bacterium]|nr:MAG: transcription termination factor NusA [Planctomycetota bacterium]
MDAQEFLRLIDSISRDRGLDKDLMLDEIEHALVQAAAKRFEASGDFTLTIDRETGEIRAFEDDKPVELESLGRIVANVAKQVITQRLRESERDLLYDEWLGRRHTIINGTVMRAERGMVIVSLGRTEAILPREEQIPGEIYRPGAVIRGFLITVSKKGQRVRLVLSRTHVGFVRELFYSEVPEIGDGLIEIKGIVREPGRRTKIAVHTSDPRIDPVGACVGMRGSRITKIADELGGEKIDIIPFSEDPAEYIINSLKPASILRVSYDEFRDRANVVVSRDQLPLAIGKAGQNVRLSARLTRYKIDVCSEEQAAERRAAGAVVLQRFVDAGLIDDFGREVFLDSFLNSLSVIASLSAAELAEGIEDQLPLDFGKAEQIVEMADSGLSDEERDEKNELIRRRAEEEERRSREAEEELQKSLAAESLADPANDDIMRP